MESYIKPEKPKHLDILKLRSLSDDLKLDDIRLISQDTYSDSDVWEQIIKLKAKKTLAICALQTAIVGYGRKQYGTFEIDGQKIVVTDVYKKLGVRMDGTLGSQLKSSELTPRRVQRAFRLVIKEFLDSHEDESSYLWRKYSTHDMRFRSICYPGAEHLIDDPDEINYLIETYENLDERQGTKISERVKRVFIARNLIKYQQF